MMNTPPIPPFGPFEDWPGYKQLCYRLHALQSLLRLNGQRGFLGIDVGFASIPTTDFMHLSAPASTVQLVIPQNRREFEEAGYYCRISFGICQPAMLAAIQRECSKQFEKINVRELRLGAWTGSSNALLGVYNAVALNFDNPQIRCEICMSMIDDNRFEIGLDAHGNLFDTLLFADTLQFQINAQ